VVEATCQRIAIGHVNNVVRRTRANSDTGLHPTAFIVINDAEEMVAEFPTDVRYTVGKREWTIELVSDGESEIERWQKIRQRTKK